MEQHIRYVCLTYIIYKHIFKCHTSTSVSAGEFSRKSEAAEGGSSEEYSEEVDTINLLGLICHGCSWQNHGLQISQQGLVFGQNTERVSTLNIFYGPEYVCSIVRYNCDYLGHGDHKCSTYTLIIIFTLYLSKTSSFKLLSSLKAYDTYVFFTYTLDDIRY
jgi:hypothetical protein